MSNKTEYEKRFFYSTIGQVPEPIYEEACKLLYNLDINLTLCLCNLVKALDEVESLTYERAHMEHV